MTFRLSAPKSPEWTSRYTGTVTVSFSAAHSLPGLEPGHRIGRPHGHDFTATLTFEAVSLSYPGVEVDDDGRAEIVRHVGDRLDHRDLDRLLSRPATCEAIAEHLVTWHERSARPPGQAQLVSVTLHLPDPLGGAR